jgi:hypothetical protein
MPPTYKLGPSTQSGALPPTFRRPLICETCLEALGNVASVANHERMSGRLVISMWPELREAVEHHETKCRPSGPISVLVIDDDAVAREGMRAILAREGYTVALAGNGREALDYLAGNRPALILLDISGPFHRMISAANPRTIPTQKSQACLIAPSLRCSADSKLAELVISLTGACTWR